MGCGSGWRNARDRRGEGARESVETDEPGEKKTRKKKPDKSSGDVKPGDREKQIRLDLDI
jgi:hypothetical protein